MPEPMTPAPLSDECPEGMEHWRKWVDEGPRCPTCHGIARVRTRQGQVKYGSPDWQILADLADAKREIGRLRADNATLMTALELVAQHLARLAGPCPARGDALALDHAEQVLAGDHPGENWLAVFRGAMAVVRPARAWRAAANAYRASFGSAIYVANDPAGEARSARDACNAAYDAMVAAIDALDAGSGKEASDA